MAKHPVATDGEWITPRRRNFELECCDCCLIHRINFRLLTTANGGKKIQFQAFRNNRATGQIRRRAGITIIRAQKHKFHKCVKE